MTIDKIRAWVNQFLRKTQKYTGTDNVYLAKGGFWLTSGQVISMAVSFLSSVAFANLLDPTTYGRYNYILSLAGILSILAITGIGTAVNQAVARGLEGSFYTGFKTKLKWGLLIILSAVGMAVYYWLKGNSTLPAPLLIVGAFLPITLASGLFVSFLMGKKLFEVQVRYSALNQIIGAAAIIGTLFVTKNLLWLIIVYFGSNAILNCFFYFLTKSKFHPNKEEDPKTINYAKHLSLIGTIYFVTSQLDKMLIFNFFGPIEVSIYSFAISIPSQIKGVIGSIGELAFPKLAPKSLKEIKTNIMKKVFKLFVLVGIIIALYILISPFFYKIFFPKYLSSVRYSQLFIFSLLAYPLSFLNTVFQAKMMKKELYLTKIIHIVRLILMLVLIPTYGILGAVLSLVGAEIFGGILNLFLFRLSLKNV